MLIVAVDRSGSTDSLRGNQLEQLKTLSEFATGNSRMMAVWAFDRKPVCIWGPGVPNDEKALFEVMGKELRPDPNNPHRLTRPALLLDAIAHDPDFIRQGNADIVILTDGDAEVSDDTPLFKKSAHELCQCRDTRLFVIGVRPEARTQWQSAFSKEWGERFHLTGPSQSEVDQAFRALN